MQELRLVAVSEDGTYAVLAVPGRGGRFSLPIDDRLRTVARGQFSRLAQYEIEVENPLRPKEIQDRIRAGETADEIADAAGIPIERVRRFEGPVLAEREYRAQEAQRSTVRGHTESGPGPRLGEIVLERLADADVPADALAWDSRKRTDGNWQVQLQFAVDGRPEIAEWVFDPRRRQVIPADDLARRLCLPQVDWPTGQLGGTSAATATVTPIGSRLGAHHPDARPDAHADARAEPDRAAARGAHAAPARPPAAQYPHQPTEPRPRPASPTREVGWARESAQAADAERDSVASPAASAAQVSSAQSAAQTPSAQSAGETSSAQSAAAAAQRPADGQSAADGSEPADSPDQANPGRPGRKAAGGKGRRASVPSWDEIMLGNSRQPD